MFVVENTLRVYLGNYLKQNNIYIEHVTTFSSRDIFIDVRHCKEYFGNGILT